MSSILSAGRGHGEREAVDPTLDRSIGLKRYNFRLRSSGGALMQPSRRTTGARALSTMFTLVSLLIFVAGCSKDLSRDRAADLIKRHVEFKSTDNTTLPVGRFWYDWLIIKDAFDLQEVSVEHHVRPDR
jgi:hypothetical protein